MSRFVSVLALVLAAFSTYMQFFYVRHSFHAHVLNETPTPGSNLIAVVSNSGNQPEVLEKISLLAALKQNDAELIVSSKSIEPQVIQAGGKTVLRLPGKIEDLLEQLNSTQSPVGTEIEIKVVTVAISAEGNPVMVTTPFARVVVLQKGGSDTQVYGASIDLLHPPTISDKTRR